MVVCQRSGFAGGGGGGENTQWGDLLEEVDGLAGERFGKALHK